MFVTFVVSYWHPQACCVSWCHHFAALCWLPSCVRAPNSLPPPQPRPQPKNRARQIFNGGGGLEPPKRWGMGGGRGALGPLWAHKNSKIFGQGARLTGHIAPQCTPLTSVALILFPSSTTHFVKPPLTPAHG